MAEKEWRRVKLTLYKYISDNCKRILIGLILLILSVYGFLRVYDSTYVWQSTILNNAIRPVTRRQCDLEVHDKSLSSSRKPLSIGLLMLYSTSNEGAWNKRLMSRVESNRKQFCDIHKCDLINANEVIDKSRPTAWSKFLAAKKYLPKYDYLFYLDMDIVIMNMNVSYTKFIDYAMEKGSDRTSNSPEIDIIMAQDWSGANTGAWMIRNSSWSLKFLDDAWRLGSTMVQPKSENGISFPFQYEQRVFHYMLATDKWTDRGLPKYEHFEDVRSHFVILPQCAMNSYSIHPLEYRANREISQYVHGDFLIHFPGKTPAAKEALMMHYLDKVHA